MSGQSKIIPPRLSRVLYRSFLRASKYGRHPEVFGSYGAIVYNAQCRINKEHASLALPEKPVQVRQRLKGCFQNPVTLTGYDPSCLIRDENRNIQPLEVLRVVHEQESMLAPLQVGPSKELPSLPIFDYGEIAALPGEKIQVMFLEPQYQFMASQILKSPTKRFLLRESRYSRGATMLRILSHIQFPNGNIIATCLGGRRVSILEEDTEYIDEERLADELEGGSSTLSKAINYSWLEDDKPAKAENHAVTQEWMESRQYILDLFHCVLPNQDSNLAETLEHFGMPPLEPEAFSFWALRFVLPPDDTESRIKWSFQCTNVGDRMNFIIDEAETILDAQEDDGGISTATS